jgi:hypothetical protein
MRPVYLNRCAIDHTVFSLTYISIVHYTLLISNMECFMKKVSLTLSFILMCGFSLFAKEYTLNGTKVAFTDQPGWQIDSSPTRIIIKVTEEKIELVVITITSEIMTQDATALTIIEKSAAGPGQKEIMKEEVKGSKLEESGADSIGSGLYAESKPDAETMQYGYVVFCKGKNAVKVIVKTTELNFEKQMSVIDSFLNSVRVK